MTTTDVSDSEIQAFASKLEGFGNSLSPAEQTLLAEIIATAAVYGADDVEGHADLSGISQLLYQLPYMTHSEWNFLVSHLGPVVEHIHHNVPQVLGHDLRHPLPDQLPPGFTPQ